jgi:lipopolysaccharide transport system permease protein
MFANLWRYRDLIRQMSRREIVNRYRGSLMGLLWSFLTPLFMLAVYTFVFGFVLRSRWEGRVDNQAEFAVVLFAGLVVYSLFADCVTRAPGLIISHASYVKKIVFPLEILPWAVMAAALFHAGISIAVLLLFSACLRPFLPWTVITVPLILFPLVLFTMGVSWFLAALGVFLRDTSHVVGLCISALLFLSPVLYPASTLPESVRAYLFLNPLTFPIEQFRDVVLWGRMPNWGGGGIYLVVSWGVAWLGLCWFQKTRHAFADVL